MKAAAEVLGMEKQSLHSVIQQGGIRAYMGRKGDVPTLFIKRAEVERYGTEKVAKLEDKLSRMRMDLLDKPLTKSQLREWTDKGAYEKGNGRTYDR